MQNLNFNKSTETNTTPTNKKIKIYHLDRCGDPNNTPKVFQPAIPENTLGNEDQTTKRVCFAPTISGCLNGVGVEYNSYIDIYNIYILEIDLEDDRFIFPLDLHRNKLVPDALLSQEIWYVGKENLVLHPTQIEIQDYQREPRCFTHNKLSSWLEEIFNPKPLKKLITDDIPSLIFKHIPRHDIFILPKGREIAFGEFVYDVEFKYLTDPIINKI